LLKDSGFEDLRMESIKFEASRVELANRSNNSSFERVGCSRFNCTDRTISRSDIGTDRPLFKPFKRFLGREVIESNRHNFSPQIGGFLGGRS
jgi:hypothetical protein